MTETQTKMLAASLCPFIENYCTSHQAEFDEWLKQEKLKEAAARENKATY